MNNQEKQGDESFNPRDYEQARTSKISSYSDFEYSVPKVTHPNQTQIRVPDYGLYNSKLGKFKLISGIDFKSHP